MSNCKILKHLYPTFDQIYHIHHKKYFHIRVSSYLDARFLYITFIAILFYIEFDIKLLVYILRETENNNRFVLKSTIIHEILSITWDVLNMGKFNDK